MLHLMIAVVAVAILASAFLLLLVRSSDPIWAQTPRHKADHPPNFEVEVETDWSWPR